MITTEILKDYIGIIDIETTGFSPTQDYIVEIGIVGLNPKTGDIIPLYSSLVKEKGFGEQCRNAWIFNNSNLKYEEVLDAPPAENELITVQLILRSTMGNTAFNKPFDFSFFKSRGIDVGREFDCPMQLSTNILKLPSKKKFGSYKYPNVEEAYKYFFPEETYIEAHRGFDDAKHEAKIVHELVKLGAYKF